VLEDLLPVFQKDAVLLSYFADSVGNILVKKLGLVGREYLPGLLLRVFYELVDGVVGLTRQVISRHLRNHQVLSHVLERVRVRQEHAPRPLALDRIEPDGRIVDADLLSIS